MADNKEPEWLGELDDLYASLRGMLRIVYEIDPGDGELWADLLRQDMESKIVNLTGHPKPWESDRER